MAEVEVTEPTPVTVVEEAKPSIEETMAAAYDKMNPDARVARSTDNGQFKSKEAAPAEAAPEQVTEAKAEDEISQEAAAETAEPEETPAIDVPPSWTTEAKEKWSSLSPEIQKYIADRESQVQSKISELGRAVKETEAIRPYLEPLSKVAAQRGMQPGDALQRLLAADQALEQNPVAAIQWLAQAYRVDLSQFAPMPQIGSDNPESAHFSALTQKIAQLERQLADTSHKITARDQQEMQAREQTLTASVEKFAEGKDYWPEIENEVYHQILALKSADPAKVLADPNGALKEAHDRAVKLTPSVQEKLNKAAKAEADKKASEEAKKKAEQAKKLASLNVKSSSGASPKAVAKDMYSEMEAVYDRLAAAG